MNIIYKWYCLYKVLFKRNNKHATTKQNLNNKRKSCIDIFNHHLNKIKTKIIIKEDLVENFNTKILRKYKNEKPLKIKKNKQGFIVQINSHYISINKKVLKSKSLIRYYIDYGYIGDVLLRVLNNQWVVGITLLLLGTML